MASLSERADLYTALAESLAEPEPWLCLPGREWPLFELASRYLPNSIAVPGMALIQAENLLARQERYAALSSGQSGQPRFWLYESAFLTGRILGEATFAVAKCYSQAGLQVDGSELPDGAALELAFLAHLAQNNPAAEKDFLKSHAVLWLPALGQSLARGADPVYAAIGQLLSDWITNVVTLVSAAEMVRPGVRIPVLDNAPACTLCGFCAQRCPTRALAIHETSFETALVLLASRCTGCGRCAAVCDTRLLTMEPVPVEALVGSKPQALRVSERVACKGCGQPMVSHAEMDYVIHQIGHPDWLDYCPACRVPAYMRTGGKV
ncbi:MAG: molecular chaperone TorD family protein [Chloroflexota bacterium]